MKLSEFHANIAANVISSVLMIAVLAWWIKKRGGICPTCGQRVEA